MCADDVKRLRSQVARLTRTLKEDELLRLRTQLEERVTAAEENRKSAEIELAERARLFSGTNGFLTELASLPLEENIHSVIARNLRGLVGANAGFCSNYDSERRMLRICGVDIEARVLQEITVLLGRRLEDTEFPVTDETCRQIVAGTVGRVPTVTEVSFGVIPPDLGASVQNLLCAERFIGLAHVINGKLFGTSILALGAGTSDPPAEWLELVAHVVAIFFRRRLAEEKLNRSEREYRLLFESANDFVFLQELDAERRAGRFLRINEQGARRLGYTQDDLKKLRLADIIAVGFSGFQEIQSDADNQERILETRLVTKGGELVPVRLHTRYFCREGQRLALSIGRDITGRKLALQELRKSKELLRLKNLVFDRSIAANSIADATGRITEVNETFLRIWGYSSRTEAVGLPISSFLKDPQAAATILKTLVDTGTWEGVFTATRKDGSTFIAYGLATSLTNDDGRVIGYQSAVLDVSDQEKDKQALEESEARFRLLCENSLSGIYIVEDGRFTYVNPALAEITGYSRDELIGAEASIVIHPEDRALVREQIRRRMSGEVESVKYEFRGVRKNGEVIQVLVLGVAANLGGGRRALIGNILDVTLLNRAEQDAANQVRFERLLAELSSRIATAPLEQLDDTITDAQHLMCDFLDADLSSIYRPCADKTQSLQLTYLYLRPGITLPPVPEELRSDAYFPWCQHELLSGKVLSVSSTQDLPDEADRDRLSWQHFGIKSSLMFPLVAANNEVIGTLSFDTVTKQRSWSDETGGRLRLLAQTIAHALARKQSGADLQASEQRFRATFHQAAVGIAQVGPDGQLLEVNQKLCDIVGYTRKELLQKTLQEITHPDDLGADLAQFDLMLDDELQTFHQEKRYVRKDGRIVWAFLTVACVRGPDRSLRYFISVVDDITERRRAEEERHKLLTSLAQSDRLASMGMLAAGVAHEINNPLAYILYNLESLSEDLPRYAKQLAGARQALTERLGAELSETLGADLAALNASTWFDAAKRLKDAVEGTRKIREIARGLGAFSRVESDQMMPVDLRYPIESAISLASNEIRYRAEVVKDIGSTAPVLASEGKLCQVFLNLLVNAAQAISEGDVGHNTIRLRTWQERSTVLAEVRDTGPGIPPENVERIFDPFFSTKPVGVGSGLGLSIVRTIVAGYGGTIQVDSEVGQGTRFLVRLPAFTGQPAAGKRALSEERGPAVRRGRVMIIDDEPGVLRALRRLLKDHDVVEAESGEQALELLAKDQGFEVILCDVMMRPTSGMDVHRWLLSHHPFLARQVVFLTGGAFTPNAKEYLSKVENLRVDKPFDSTSLLKLVTERVLAARTNE